MEYTKTITYTCAQFFAYSMPHVLLKKQENHVLPCTVFCGINFVCVAVIIVCRYNTSQNITNICAKNSDAFMFCNLQLEWKTFPHKLLWQERHHYCIMLIFSEKITTFSCKFHNYFEKWILSAKHPLFLELLLMKH